jgi:hypothetical protein
MDWSPPTQFTTKEQLLHNPSSPHKLGWRSAEKNIPFFELASSSAASRSFKISMARTSCRNLWRHRIGPKDVFSSFLSASERKLCRRNSVLRNPLTATRPCDSCIYNYYTGVVEDCAAVLELGRRKKVLSEKAYKCSAASLYSAGAATRDRGFEYLGQFKHSLTAGSRS